MRIASTSVTVLAALGLGAPLGCAATDPVGPDRVPPVARVSAALEADATSIDCAVGTTICPVLTNAMSATWPSALASIPCDGCRFTNGRDQMASGESRPVANLGGADLSYDWDLPRWDAGGGLQSRWATLASQSRAFVDPAAADSPAAELSEQLAAVANALQPLTLLGGTIAGPSVSANNWKVSFPPSTGRGYISSTEAGYGEIAPLQELRNRGALSYCAMREATFQQNGGALDLGGGSAGHALFWDFGQANGALRLFPPKRIEGGLSSDTPTAEAYLIPMTVGARLTPARGPLLPDFGELAHPLVWMTGDAEVITREDPASLITPPHCIGCKPIVTTIYTKTARNLYHADLMAGVATSGRLELRDLVVADFGFVRVLLGGNIDIALGQLELSNSYGMGGVAAAPADWRGPRPTALTPSGTLACDAAFSGSLKSSSWTAHAVDGLPFEIRSARGQTFVRWTNDDDRAVVVRDTISESVNAGCDVRIPLGPLRVGVRGNTSFSATSELLLVVREQLSSEGRRPNPLTDSYTSRPQSNLVITPELHSDVQVKPFELIGYFSLHLNLLFTSIDVDWQHSFLSLEPVPLSQLNPTRALAGEERRLRVGEFSESMNGAAQPLQPNVYSHLPGTTSGFAAFPVSLPTCLADPMVPPQPSGLDQPAPVEGPIQGNTCAYGFVNDKALMAEPMPAGICRSPDRIVRWANSAICHSFSDCDKLKSCYRDILAILCKAQSRQQSFGGQTVLAHAIAGNEEPTQLGETIQQCAQAFAWRIEDPTQAERTAKTFLSQFVVPAHACDASAHLLE